MSEYQDTYNRAQRPKPKPRAEAIKRFTPKSTAGAYAMGSPGAPAKPYKKSEPKKDKTEKPKEFKPKDTSKAFAMGTSGGIRFSTKGKIQAAARRRTEKTASDRYAESLEKNSVKYKTRAKIDARDPGKQDRPNVNEMRKRRIASGDFKGKHYGPDEFKGNLAVLKAWRRAGSPKDTAGFNKNYKTTQKRYEARANRAG